MKGKWHSRVAEGARHRARSRWGDAWARLGDNQRQGELARAAVEAVMAIDASETTLTIGDVQHMLMLATDDR